MSRKPRFSGEEKLRVLEESRQPGANVSEVCRRHGISSSMFYRWEAQMRAGAREALREGRPKGADRAQAEIARLKAELAKKNDVIAELTEALVQEKRGLSDYLRGGDSSRR